MKLVASDYVVEGGETLYKLSPFYDIEDEDVADLLDEGMDVEDAINEVLADLPRSLYAVADSSLTMDEVEEPFVDMVSNETGFLLYGLGIERLTKKVKEA